MPKKLKNFSLKIHKVLEFFKTPQTFLNKDTKHNRNYIDNYSYL